MSVGHSVKRSSWAERSRSMIADVAKWHIVLRLRMIARRASGNGSPQEGDQMQRWVMKSTYHLKTKVPMIARYLVF